MGKGSRCGVPCGTALAPRLGTSAEEGGVSTETERAKGEMAIAVLGAGRIGRLHASLLAANPAVGSLLVVDPIQDRAEAVAMGEEGS